MQTDHRNEDEAGQSMQTDHLNRKGLSERPHTRPRHHGKEQEIEKGYETSFFQNTDQALPGTIAPCFFSKSWIFAKGTSEGVVFP